MLSSLWLTVPEPRSERQGTGSASVTFVLVGLATGTVAVGAMMKVAGLSLDLSAPGTRAFAIVLIGLAAVRWLLRSPLTNGERAMRDTAEYFGVFTAISLLGAVASYPVAAFSHGFADARLHHFDLALRFNWLAWYQLVAMHPLVQMVSRTSYAMIYLSPAVLLGYCALRGRREEAYHFILAVLVAAILTLVVFRFAPAIGPFGYLWHGRIPYLPVSDLWQPYLIPQLRNHAASPIDLGHLVGLVSVPSFHAAAAVLLIVFAARYREIRWPLICANIAMLVSTPVEGTHYLVDILAGVLIAAISLALIRVVRTASTGFQKAGGASL